MPSDSRNLSWRLFRRPASPRPSSGPGPRAAEGVREILPPGPQGRRRLDRIGDPFFTPCTEPARSFALNAGSTPADGNRSSPVFSKRLRLSGLLGPTLEDACLVRKSQRRLLITAELGIHF